MAIELIAKIKQKNSQSFALVDAKDIAVDDADKRLDVKLSELESSLSGIDKNIIDDSSAQANKTYSSQKIVQEIAAKCDELKNNLLGGAGDAYDTLKELADLIETNKSALEALQELAGAHIRYDQAQELEPTEKQQARENIGALDAAVAGELTSLTTGAKGTLVAAINEVDANADAAKTAADGAQSAAEAAQSKADANATAIGTVASLATDAKTNLVEAVNEVNTNADKANTDLAAFKESVGDVNTDFVAIFEAALSSDAA